MDLFLFPEAANDLNGYSIGVNAAYSRMKPKDEDEVVWYTSYPREKMWHVREKDYIIERPKLLSWKSVFNTLRGTNRSELSVKDLSFLKDSSFDSIYCDETIFYHALRRLFPDKDLFIRFHNCYARIYDRLRLLNKRIDLKYAITLRNMYMLERDVMNDRRVYKVFISEEDRDYYTSHFGVKSDSEVFDYSPDMDRVSRSRLVVPSFDNKLIWFGGVESHKKAAIDWFLEEVWPCLHEKCPYLEFHLWGSNTVQFNSPENNVYGHGFFDGKGLPSAGSLYINPDVIGGGIKLKLLGLLENGVPFISSPFGFEGYSYGLVDGIFCTVAEDSEWVDAIMSILGIGM